MPTNVAIADAMGSGFMRERGGFTVNSRAGRSQLLRWTLDQKKRRPVTGKRMRRRQDMRSAPVGPAGGMRNVSTEQGVSSRGQPVVSVGLSRPILLREEGALSPTKSALSRPNCRTHTQLALSREGKPLSLRREVKYVKVCETSVSLISLRYSTPAIVIHYIHVRRRPVVHGR